MRGLPTFEDKLLQRAVLMVLEPVFEKEFFDFSHGFRPGHSAHLALDEFWLKNYKLGGGWLIDLDIRKYFDTIDHEQLRKMICSRVCDGVITRIIGKWLKAGVFDNGNVTLGKSGTPQGGVISPLLSNVYLHEVLDKWFVETVKSRLKGNSFIVRYADDCLMMFKEREIQQICEGLQKGFVTIALLFEITFQRGGHKLQSHLLHTGAYRFAERIHEAVPTS